VELTYCIDWLRASAPNNYPLQDIIPEMFVLDYQSELSPLTNYTHAYKIYPAGRLDWNVKNEKQGSLMSFSGSDLREIGQAGISGQFLARHVAKHAWLKASRIDLALDLTGGKYDPSSIFRAWRRKRIETHARDCNQIIGYDKECDRTGNTVYIGSRKSDTFLRIYDKGAEQANDELWTRIEFELKSGRAKTAVKRVASNGIQEVISSVLQSYVKVNGVKWWDEMITLLPSANEIMKGERKSKDTNSKLWLEEQALPAVCKAIIEGNEYVRDEVLRALIAYGNNQNHLTAE